MTGVWELCVCGWVAGEVDRVQQRPECRAMDGTPSIHPCGQYMTGPSCPDWGGPCDQGLRTEVCGLMWNQIHFWIHCAFHSQLCPAWLLPLLVKSYFCSTWRAPWRCREKGQSGQRSHVLPFACPCPAGPRHLPACPTSPLHSPLPRTHCPWSRI